MDDGSSPDKGVGALESRQKEQGGRVSPAALFCRAAWCTDQLQVLAFLPLVRQLPEQHWPFEVHEEPLDPHEQDGAELQALSLQSTWPLQLSSLPLPQVSLAAAQSVAQFEQFSLPPQVSSPQQ